MPVSSGESWILTSASALNLVQYLVLVEDEENSASQMCSWKKEE